VPKNPDVYQAYHPYVAPITAAMVPVPRAPVVVETDAPPPTDPAMLPGFTGEAHAGIPMSPDGDTANVAAEQDDPASLLNLYRRLIKLHHDNPALHSGAQTFLQQDALNALVWLRQPAAGVRTAGDVVAVCNLSAAPLHISLTAELTELHVRGGTLRNLLSLSGTGPEPQRIAPVQATDDLSLPPFAVLLGELYH
jgi:hypothetical protein